MNRDFFILFVKNTVLIISLSTILSSCKDVNKNHPQFQTDRLVAYFDNFSYKGDDDFYNANPLPGDDYYYNPIIPGWYSDPSVATDGKNYFLVTSTFSFFPGVPIFHSTDLMNWKQIGYVLDRSEQLPLDGQRTSEGIFAPDISYNPYNKTWYMITTNIKYGNFFVKTQDPFGAWSDPIWLPDVNGIDPSFFFDNDGKAYIVNNDEPIGGSHYKGHRSIRVIEFDVDKEITIGKSKMLVNGGVNIDKKPIWIEGPHVYKINNQYYLMCAEGGTSVNHSEVIFRSDSPMGSFEPAKENPILTQRYLPKDRELPITCAGHADLIQKDDGQWWSLFLACRPINNRFENLGRETFLMPVRWNKDGFPYLTTGDELIPRIIQMKGVKRDDSVTFGNFEVMDDFDSIELGKEWQTLRGDARELYSTNTNPGYLTLKCANIASNELKELPYVCRRIQHHKFECASKMYFNPQAENESAGLLLYKDETHQYLFALSMKYKSPVIQLKKIKADGVEVLAEQKINLRKSFVDLKIVSNGLNFNFQYKIGSGQWNTLASKVDAYYLSTSQANGFTGTVIGLFASSKDYEFQ